MGDRKVTNKYIPPDFDPSLVPRGKKLSSKDGTVPVRMMLPFSMQCSTCHTFLYRGRKFNSKKEPMLGQDYLGIARFRFYIKCTHCARPISFVTDPQNADYSVESGATRNYEMQKDKQEQEETQDEEQHDDKADPMKALEQRVLQSQREMADMDQLEEIRALNARHGKLQVDEIWKQKQNDRHNTTTELTAQDEALVQSIQFGKALQHRLSTADEAKHDELRQRQAQTVVQPPKPKSRPVLVVKKRKRKEESKADDAKNSAGLSGLLGGYGSDSD